MKKELISPKADAWNWQGNNPFSRSVIVGDQVFVSGQQSLDKNGQVLDPGDIGAQTRHVFENMKASLQQVGLELSDLVRLNTYYVFDGTDDDATQYWEDMTQVRLEYFPNPGPAATAVRIKGMPYAGQLIQIEGIALRGESRKNLERIMPEDSWDWSIPVPLSQGWKVEDHIYVGGQISADKNGEPVHADDLDAQTHAIYDFIENVLTDSGSSFEDLVHIKVCFKHDSYTDAGQSYADRIMDITTDVVGSSSSPAMTAFGVDLLYPGLVLELDAMAIVDSGRKKLTCNDIGERYQPDAFADGSSAGGEIWVSGQTALGSDGAITHAGDVEAQSRVVFGRLKQILAKDDATLNDIVKINIFIVGDDDQIEGIFHTASRVWAEIAPDAHPAMTPVRVHELARPGALIQADCIAIKE
ncbi:MAG: hypothetical protein HON65_00330 [Rhodospirillales bacterium]|nr:hypothetical protein [Rhodospirillales bacterium]